MAVPPHVPHLGIRQNPTFPLQFEATFDARSLACTPIEYPDLDGGPRSLPHATGFFYRMGERVYLTSARHAITLLNAFTDEPLVGGGSLPRQLRVYPAIRNADSSNRIAGGIVVDVRNSSDRPLWRQDPQFAALRTDIACVEVVHPNAATFWCVNDGQDEDLFVNIGSEVYVVGYPNRSYGNPFLPVWRRGSLAYEPSAPVDDKPIFLVDGRTSAGMSGAPIFQRWHGPAPRRNGSGGLTTNLDAVVSTRFVGVYGGRLANSDQLAELGYGWYANRIPIILAPTPPGLFSPWTGQ